LLLRPDHRRIPWSPTAPPGSSTRCCPVGPPAGQLSHPGTGAAG